MCSSKPRMYHYDCIHMPKTLALYDIRVLEKQIVIFTAFRLTFGNGNITISCAIHLATYLIQTVIFHQKWRYEVLKE